MNCLSFKISLFKLNRERRKLTNVISKAAEEARETGGRRKVREVWDAARYDFDEIDDKIIGLLTGYLVSKAARRFLPTPSLSEEDGMWERSNFTGNYHLTDKGIREIRGMIRKETRERMEIHAPWLSLLIGIIGAITGLIAVIKR